jgi:hypothetical protein
MEVVRYRNLNGFLRKRFGHRVHKVGVCGGFGCPNRDGSIDTAGCAFCNPRSSLPKSYRSGDSITEQLRKGTEYVSERFGADRFIAYLQDQTTTHGPVDHLERTCEEALEYPGVVGLALCTRPDCLPDEVLALFRRIAERTLLWVEVGVQSASDGILRSMNRGHTAADAEDALRRLRELPLLTSAHVILGYPGESEEDVWSTVELLNRTRTDGVKIHNLHVVEGTQLAKHYKEGLFEMVSLEHYAGLVAEFLERLEPDVIVERLTGEAPPEMTLAPDWSLHKQLALGRIRSVLAERATWQGRLLGYSIEELRAIIESDLTPGGSLAR